MVKSRQGPSALKRPVVKTQAIKIITDCLPAICLTYSFDDRIWGGNVFETKMYHKLDMADPILNKHLKFYFYC